jgi:hypothetical protein
MFETIGRLAETAANNLGVSRRGFLGRLGQGALAAAGVLGGFLISANDAPAGSGVVCCYYTCYKSPYGPKPYHPYRYKTTCQAKGPCAPPARGCYLRGSSTAAGCKYC